MTALVEGPLELFRHQAQAGIISGNLFHEMRHVVRTQVRGAGETGEGGEGGKAGWRIGRARKHARGLDR